jgi:hypothetical protein
MSSNWHQTAAGSATSEMNLLATGGGTSTEQSKPASLINSSHIDQRYEIY